VCLGSSPSEAAISLLPLCLDMPRRDFLGISFPLYTQGLLDRMVLRVALEARMLLTTSSSFGFLRFGCGAAALFLLLCNGCGTGSGETREQADQRIAAQHARSARAVKESIVQKQHQLSIPELDQLTYAYADRYFMVISSAVDAIKRGNPDPLQRRRAHQ